ncbi:WD repeat-containing protein 36 [Hypsibius exemplaris]|uniref:WD repeat-containing protein 36 n=1 Tax=Hypsibius exemplaris TaxID=2072580 RepID=A0A9X6NPS7_HYPEX|nr:WD repeat-containing protein 36 [Hypsibius exemplaris]
MPDLMITASQLGHLAIWNLDTERLVTQKENVHALSITGLKCFPFQPIFATSSPDNSIRVWIMDDEVNGARLLMFKEGHQAPPTRIRFYGDEGNNILSAGNDSCLRSFSLEAELLSFSLGKASFNRKLAKKTGVSRDQSVMPPIVEFAAESVREGGWESEGVHGKEKANIVAIHSGVRQVSVWSYGRRTKCSFRLLHERFAKHTTVHPTSVAVTVCGNFCIIGYNTGHVDRFNLQSAIHRTAYGEPKAHLTSVAAVASDSLNEQVFSAAGTDVNFWNFKSGKLVGSLKTASAVTAMQTFRDNSIAAVALNDCSIEIVDMDIRRITRTFSGHKDTITDMAFSPDSRWLVSASRDCSIRVWDLSSASLVDCFQTLSPCVSLTFSPTGEYLASAHQHDLGIFLWTNKTVYCPITLTSMPFDAVPEVLTLPGTAPTGEELFPADADEEMPIDAGYTSPDQLAQHLLTLSLLPEYRWKHLAKQDLIRERNKPKEALKVPEKAPFFLPTIPGLEPKFDTSAKDAAGNASTSVKSVARLIGGSSPFREALETREVTPEAVRRPFELLATLSPSQIESEIRLLSPDAGGSVAAMKAFLRLAAGAIADGRHQELGQSYVELFLKLHIAAMESELVDEEFAELLGRLRQTVEGVARRVEDLLDESLNVVLFLKHVAL